MDYAADERRLADRAAEVIWDGFNAYRREFDRITRRACKRFEERDWPGMQADARNRLRVYARRIDGAVATIHEVLGIHLQDKHLWAAMKTGYAGRVEHSEQPELAATFFNSVTRRIFATVGVNPRIEFVDQDLAGGRDARGDAVYTSFSGQPTTAALIRNILEHHAFRVPYAAAHDDAELVAEVVEAERRHRKLAEPIERIDVVRSVFYRGHRAFLVGRALAGPHAIPLVIVLLHGDDGVAVDAALINEDDVSIVFSFTRSYLHVQVRRPSEVVEFLSSIMPLKRVAELYIAIGYNKHGKTALYRDLLRHLAASSDQFQIAPGERGMVMIVFTLPSYDVVFKVIRERFIPPKNTTRKEVMQKYQLVFGHDRAGRLVDAQEFEHLSFEKARFSEPLLAELLAHAADSVHVSGDRVHIRHLYTERRIYPLNLYLAQRNERDRQAALIDYGQSIKDLALSNIFPGDLLIKNFGVTRHGRVIFYDYDELCLLEDCNFRDMPVAQTYEDEMSAEPWFYVGPNDIFPEEFVRFLGLDDASLRLFLEHHGDLLIAARWRSLQQRHADGEVADIVPYPDSLRVRRSRPRT